jgi:hypothetical protein
MRRRILLVLVEFGPGLGLGLHPLTGVLLTQTLGLLSKALARPSLDAAADLLKLVLGDVLVAVGTGLAAEMEMGLGRGVERGGRGCGNRGCSELG